MTKSRRNTIIDRNYNSNGYDNLPYYDTDEKNIRFVRITEENGIDNGMTLYFVTSKEASLRLVFKLMLHIRVRIGSDRALFGLVQVVINLKTFYRPQNSWSSTASPISRPNQRRVVETIRFTISNEDGQAGF